MKYLDRTEPDAAANLTLDDRLLAGCESGAAGEVLRVWEPSEYAVVAGYGNPRFDEVRRDFCRSRNIPLVRRSSGGGTVVIGPGSINYALVLRIDGNEALTGIRQTNRYVMERNRRMLERVLGRDVVVAGFTDLVVDGRKVSGNAQRRKRNAVLFHGTFLLNVEMSMMERVLDVPVAAPRYREGRSHRDFLMNLQVSAGAIKHALREEWAARDGADTA
jgi:lipoate-protein ligase A